MSAKSEIKTIKKKLGMNKRRVMWLPAYGYNDNDEPLYDVISLTEGKVRESHTEKEIREMYPETDFKLIFNVIGVSDGNGQPKLDEKGRPEIMDFREV